MNDESKYPVQDIKKTADATQEYNNAVSSAINNYKLLMQNKQIIYTDGACRNNGTPNAKGGWAFVVSVNGKETHSQSGCITENPTNNVAELRAVLEALKYCDKEAVIKSDSAYVCNCLNQKWYVKWIRNNWKRRDGTQWKPVLNRELWEEIITLFLSKKVKIEKVAGHSGDWFNERADELATKSIGD